MATRQEQKTARMLRLLRQAADTFPRICVEERAAQEASRLRSLLRETIEAAEDFETENAPYSADEMAEDA